VASVRDPEVIASSSARRYVAGTSTDIDRDGPVLRGERTRQVSFLPDGPGTFVIQPVRFAWFDPEEGRYRSANADTIRIRVLPSTGAARGPAPGGPRFAAPLAPPRSRPGPTGPLGAAPPPGSVAVGSLALLAYAGTIATARWRAWRSRDPRALRRAALGRLLAEGIGDCRARVARGEGGAAATRAAQVLRDAVAKRYDLPARGETELELLEAARARGAAAAEAEALARLFDRLRTAAFAPPGAADGDAGALVGAVEETVRRYAGELR